MSARRWLVLLGVLLLGLGISPEAWASPGTNALPAHGTASLGGAGRAAPFVQPSALAATTGDSDTPMVLLGIAGLRWDDVSATSMPTLWRLLQDAAIGSLVVRAAGPLTCPADGWLTLGAGQRARIDTDQGRLANCTDLQVEGGTDSSASIPSWPGIVAHNADLSYDATLGLLGQALRQAGSSTDATAVGPLAALALADTTGAVARFIPELSELGRAQPTLTLVDAGSVLDPAAIDGTPSRLAQVRVADDRIRAVAEARPASQLLVLGLADGSNTSHLGVAASVSPGGSAGWLTSSSTRRESLVLLTDIAPTLLAHVGVPIPAAMSGAVLGSAARSAALPDAVAQLQDADLSATVVRRMLSPFFTGLVLLQLLLYTGAGVLLRGRLGRRALRAVGVVAALVPVSTFLAQLVPWWRAGRPLLMVTLLVAAIAVALGVGALAARTVGTARTVSTAGASSVVRSSLLVPGPLLLAGLTTLVLGADIATGSRLQQASLMGYTPVVAGRFYGFGNVAFALFGAGALVATGGLVLLLRRAGRSSREQVALVVVAGLGAVVLDGPVGVDFGGVLALVPAFAVLGLGVAGLRLTWRRGLLIGSGAVLAVSLIAVADWLRPVSARTHLGRFVAQVLDGSAVDIVSRKAQANYSVLFTFLGLIVPFAVAFLVLVLLRGAPWREPLLRRMLDREPLLGPVLFSVLTLAVIGFAVNDSGIAIPAVICTLVVPLVIAMAATTLLADDASRTAPCPE